jgi:hypothetical protein
MLLQKVGQDPVETGRVLDVGAATGPSIRQWMRMPFARTSIA